MCNSLRPPAWLRCPVPPGGPPEAGRGRVPLRAGPPPLARGRRGLQAALRAVRGPPGLGERGGRLRGHRQARVQGEIVLTFLTLYVIF